MRCAEIFAGDARHHLIQRQHQVERLAAVPGAFQFRLGGESVGDGGCEDAVSAELAAQYIQVHLDIVDQQHFEGLQMRGLASLDRACARWSAELPPAPVGLSETHAA